MFVVVTEIRSLKSLDGAQQWGLQESSCTLLVAPMIFPAAARLSGVKFTQQLRKVTALEGVQETESRFVLVVFFSPPTLPLLRWLLLLEESCW